MGRDVERGYHLTGIDRMGSPLFVFHLDHDICFMSQLNWPFAEQTCPHLLPRGYDKIVIRSGLLDS